jgi:hypothetical protein
MATWPTLLPLQLLLQQAFTSHCQEHCIHHFSFCTCWLACYCCCSQAANQRSASRFIAEFLSTNPPHLGHVCCLPDEAGVGWASAEQQPAAEVAHALAHRQDVHEGGLARTTGAHQSLQSAT